MNRTRVSRRALATAALVSGLVTGLSACGGSPSGSAAATATESAAPAAQSAAAPEPEQAAPVTQPVLASPQPDSPLVSCGLAQLRPRVADGDPLLGRAEAFYHQLSVAQLVPPAVRGVYAVDVGALTPSQRHEVLLLLSSLNQCPDVSAQLQQSILDVFDQLAPQSVAQPNTDDAGGSDDTVDTDASDDTGEQIRSDNVDSDDDYADGWGDGYGWWFRPCWTHPSSDHDRWAQWGRDRRDGIWWGWTGSAWERFGTHRPVDTPPDPGKPTGTAHHRPWIPGRHGVPVPPGDTGHWPGNSSQTSGQNQGGGQNRGAGIGEPGGWQGGRPNGTGTGGNSTGDRAGDDQALHGHRSIDPAGTDPASTDNGSSVTPNSGSTSAGGDPERRRHDSTSHDPSGDTGPSQSTGTLHQPDSSSPGWQSHHDSTHQDFSHQDGTTGTQPHFDQQPHSEPSQPHFEQPHSEPAQPQVQPPAPQPHVQPPAPQQPAGPGSPGVHHP